MRSIAGKRASVRLGRTARRDGDDPRLHGRAGDVDTILLHRQESRPPRVVRIMKMVVTRCAVSARSRARLTCCFEAADRGWRGNQLRSPPAVTPWVLRVSAVAA